MFRSLRGQIAHGCGDETSIGPLPPGDWLF